MDLATLGLWTPPQRSDLTLARVISSASEDILEGETVLFSTRAGIKVNKKYILLARTDVVAILEN
jgi:hypothetical protein